MKLKDQKKLKINNCWDCGLRRKGGINAFGTCTWWGTPKEIPPHIVDNGCKYWRSEIAQKAINKFDGRLIYG